MSPTVTSVSPAELTGLLSQALERASQPLTLFQIQRRLPRSWQGRADDIRQALHELTSQGSIHEFAPYRSKTPRFWTQPPEQHARLVLMETLAEQAVTPRELFVKLRRRLPGTSGDQLGQLLNEMLLEGQIRKLPPRLGGRDNLLSARAAQPRDYLQPVFRTLFDTMHEVSKRLEAEGIEREEFVREAEEMWCSMPWERLSEPPAPRRSARRRTGSPPPTEPEPRETPFEPTAPVSAEDRPFQLESPSE